MRSQLIPFPDVKPGALVKVDTQIITKIAGDQKIIVTFTSKELVDVTGSIKIEVYDDDE